MSRSVADFLYEESEFEKEYKNIFSDKVEEESSAADIELENQIIENEKQRTLNLKKQRNLQKLFTEFKNESNKFGFLLKLNFFDFCEFVGESHIFIEK